MRRILFALLAMSMPLLAVDINTPSEALLREISRGFSHIAKQARPAVVYIESQGVPKESDPVIQRGPRENPFDYFHDEFFNRFFGYPPRRQQPNKRVETVRGSGFIMRPDGYIVTNNHVVEGATKITVTLHTGDKRVATIVGNDPKSDLAVIKIDEEKLPFLLFGDSNKLEVGEWAIAIGNPFGLSESVTVGVVSAKGRSQLNITDFEDFIQTDAAINPGNSGGPLLNIEGEVIGINTAIVSGSGGYMGIGFAIPSRMAERIIEQLIENGSVTRGFLGVTMQPIDSDLASYYKLPKVAGALVTDVSKGSPADLGGLEREDIILEYNGKDVETLSAFRNAVAMMKPGSKLRMKVKRDGKIITVNVTIATLPQDIVANGSLLDRLGMSVQPLTPEIAKKLGYTDEEGVVVTAVKPGGAAASVGLRPGSLIVAVNRKNVTSVEELNEALAASKGDKRLLLMVRQGEIVRFVALTLD